MPPRSQIATAGLAGTCSEPGRRSRGLRLLKVLGQLAPAAGLLHGVELHALWPVVLEQFGQVLLIADVARAGRAQVHHANRPGPARCSEVRKGSPENTAVCELNARR